jgi:hypothetical protein
MFLKEKMRFILHCVTPLGWGFPKKKLTSPQPQTFWLVILGMAQPLGHYYPTHKKYTLQKFPIFYFWKINFLEGTKEKKKLKKFPRK